MDDQELRERLTEIQQLLIAIGLHTGALQTNTPEPTNNTNTTSTPETPTIIPTKKKVRIGDKKE